MAKITITCEIDDEFADGNHPMGVTDEGYSAIVSGLIEAVGADDVQVAKAD